MILRNCMMVWAHTAKRLCGKSMEALIKEFGLSYVELGILLFLHEHPQFDTSRDIAEFLMLAKSNVSTAVENLVQRGYLKRQADPSDRRMIHLKLMETAQALIKQGDKAHEQLLNQLFAGFSTEEMAQVTGFCQRLYTNAQEMLKE